MALLVRANLAKEEEDERRRRIAEVRRQFVASLRDAVGEVPEDSELGTWLAWTGRHLEQLGLFRRFRTRQPTLAVCYAFSYLVQSLGESPEGPALPNRSRAPRMDLALFYNQGDVPNLRRA